jgi:cephalosporin hydroxylase
MTDDTLEFEKEKKTSIKKMYTDPEMGELNRRWFDLSFEHKYPYNFSWLGLPIIQYPQDIVAIQEIVWKVQPKTIIETGIARGGSLIFYSSLVKLLGNQGKVIGIDIEIRNHNRKRIEKHSLFDSIELVEGSSIDPSTILKVEKIIDTSKPVLVVLDSNHTHDHVLSELRMYKDFVTKGSYIIVLDTHCENLPQHLLANRPWGKGNSPMTAVVEFLKSNKNFQVDNEIHEKLGVTGAPSGYIKRVD